MRAAAIAGAVLAGVLLLAGPVAAQGKDPFRPPASSGGSGAPAGGGAAVGGTGSTPVPQAPASRSGLPRTGLDYSLPVLAAGVLIAAGASMRLTSGVLAP